MNRRWLALSGVPMRGATVKPGWESGSLTQLWDKCSAQPMRRRLRGLFVGPHAKLIPCRIDVMKAAAPWKTDDLPGYPAASLDDAFSRPFQISGEQNHQRPWQPVLSTALNPEVVPLSLVSEYSSPQS